MSQSSAFYAFNNIGFARPSTQDRCFQMNPIWAIWAKMEEKIKHAFSIVSSWPSSVIMGLELVPFLLLFHFQAIFDSMGKKFWETDPAIWDLINNTGLR